MSELPTIDLNSLATEAIATASDFLEAAESWVDNQFGSGYAEKHPALVAGFLQACALTYQAHRVAISLDDLAAAFGTFAEVLATHIESIDEAVDGIIERERGEGVGS